MKDSQPLAACLREERKYIKESNERFSTCDAGIVIINLSISRRVMKDSQLWSGINENSAKYIKESNERFSTG